MMFDALSEGEELLWLGPRSVSSLAATCAHWRRELAGNMSLWQALALRSPVVACMDLDEDAVDWRQMCEHSDFRTPAAGRCAALKRVGMDLEPAPRFLLVVEARPWRRPRTRNVVSLGGAWDVPASTLRGVFASAVGDAAIVDVSPSRAVFGSDAAAEAATKMDGIALSSPAGPRRLRVTVEAADAWKMVGVAALDWSDASRDRLRSARPIDDELKEADAVGARCLRFSVVAYQRGGLFMPTVVFRKDVARSDLDTGDVAAGSWAASRYNALGANPCVRRGTFFWGGGGAAQWGHLRVTRTRRRGDGAVCGHCARDAPEMLRCCAAASFCDAHCARAAWLFKHRRRCPRDRPVDGPESGRPHTASSA